jgi:hypothetical protein
VYFPPVLVLTYTHHTAQVHTPHCSRTHTTLTLTEHFLV